ncbi:hypothetical protein ABZ622_41810 [Streptomyces sp. NPDC007164]|uniref:hypothetical protein n=1 Tax=Streptomyces sp. NPDC007164 TaxID=3156918 RepID=UPI0033D49809
MYTASPSRTVPGRSSMPATARSIQCWVTTLPDRAYSTTVSSVRVTAPVSVHAAVIEHSAAGHKTHRIYQAQ